MITCPLTKSACNMQYCEWWYTKYNTCMIMFIGVSLGLYCERNSK